jgi:hypothetical protein
MKLITTILVTAVFLVECAACTSKPSTPAIAKSATSTITSEDNHCEYSGPDKIQADQFTFQWVMNGQQHPGYHIMAFQVEDGHSVDDLVGIKYNDAPSWVSLLRWDQGSFQPGPWAKEVTWNLTVSGRFQPKPVYFGCMYVENEEEFINGVTGPVEVEN